MDDASRAERFGHYDHGVFPDAPVRLRPSTEGWRVTVRVSRFNGDSIRGRSTHRARDVAETNPQTKLDASIGTIEEDQIGVNDET